MIFRRILFFLLLAAPCLNAGSTTPIVRTDVVSPAIADWIAWAATVLWCSVVWGDLRQR